MRKKEYWTRENLILMGVLGFFILYFFIQLSQDNTTETSTLPQNEISGIELPQEIAQDTVILSTPQWEYDVSDTENYSYDDYPHVSGLHWGKMPIKYFIINPEICGDKIVGQIKVALETIQNETDGLVNFEEGTLEEGISFECFHRYGDNVPISMRAGSTYAYAGVTYVFDDGIENVISNGEVKLYRITPGEYYGRCGSEPVTIIHEILHVFDFDDTGESDSIMYMYVGICDIDIDKKIINKLKKDYAILNSTNK